MPYTRDASGDQLKAILVATEGLVNDTTKLVQSGVDAVASAEPVTTTGLTAAQTSIDKLAAGAAAQLVSDTAASAATELKVTASGVVTPLAMNGVFNPTGIHSGKVYWKHATQNYWLWWTGGLWQVTDVLGSSTNIYADKGAGATITGTYGQHVAGITGTLVMTLTP
jgi:hypothetical protein